MNSASSGPILLIALNLLPFTCLLLLYAVPILAIWRIIADTPSCHFTVRPKFILVRIGPRSFPSTSSTSLRDDVRTAVRYLRRKGFSVSEEKEDENLCGEYVLSSSTITDQQQITVKRYACVWGTRLNEFELTHWALTAPFYLILFLFPLYFRSAQTFLQNNFTWFLIKIVTHFCPTDVDAFAPL